MENISDIKIESIDESRPPSVEHKTYINLIFKLNHQAPSLWCALFNTIMSKHPSKAKLDIEEGIHIETWVKSPGEIAAHLELLKEAVSSATAEYIEQIRLSTLVPDTGDSSEVGADSPQGKLNKIIDELDFGS
ncbi:MAG: hypothetical protein OQL16_02730 [Gammaproteobacteria bacterium]|nr:hypothetical protein [Gammaproteobacteria bacterium]